MSGRPPLQRGVYCIQSCEPPAEIALDTSFLVAVINSGEPHHSEALAFMRKLVHAQSLLVYNRLLEVELVEVAFKLAVKEQHGRNSWPARRSDGRVRRRAARLAEDVFTGWADLKSASPTLQIELHEVSDQVFTIMKDWGLASYDAVHAASAIYGAAGSIVTFDAGFGSVPERDLKVFVDRSRVTSCRNRRGGRVNGP